MGGRTMPGAGRPGAGGGADGKDGADEEAMDVAEALAAADRESTAAAPDADLDQPGDHETGTAGAAAAHAHHGACGCGHVHAEGDDDAAEEAAERDPDDPVEQAWAAYDDDRFEEARELAERQLEAGADGDDAIELLHVVGLSALDLGDPDGAFDALTEALAQAPEDPALLVALGEAEVERWRFQDAERTFRRALAIQPEEPFAHRMLAETLDRLGRGKEAEKHFARAQTLDPEAFPRPFRLNRRSFDQLVEAAVACLPDPIRDRLGDIRVEVHDYPEPVQVEMEDGQGSPRTLGFFHATPFPDKRSDAGLTYSPEHILLFQRNLEHVVADRAELEEEIRTTVIHEVGHYLGLDEDELEEMGLA